MLAICCLWSRSTINLADECWMSLMPSEHWQAWADVKESPTDKRGWQDVYEGRDLLSNSSGIRWNAGSSPTEESIPGMQSDYPAILQSDQM